MNAMRLETRKALPGILSITTNHYADTALNGSKAGLMCGYEFFSADHMLFATDLPSDHHFGYRMTKETIESVEQLDIPESEKRAIFEGNARKFLRLPA